MHTAVTLPPRSPPQWVAFGFCLFATTVFTGISLIETNKKNSLFNSLATAIVAISSLAYLIEALGNTEMDTVRPLLWIRYVREWRRGREGGERSGCGIRFASESECAAQRLSNPLCPFNPPTPPSPTEWATNTPLILLSLGLLAGVTAAEVFFTTTLALVVTSALFAGAISTGYNATWPLYTFGEQRQQMG